MKPKACSCGKIYISCPIDAKIDKTKMLFLFECDDCHSSLVWPITIELLISLLHLELKKCQDISERLEHLSHEDYEQPQLPAVDSKSSSQ